jgi:hypothetical protein
MKRSLVPCVFSLMLLIGPGLSASVSAQAPPPPPTSGTKGDATNKAPGGGAPIDGSLVISLALIAAYGSLKTYKAFKAKKQAV